jgi:hypothetical protein
LSFPLAVAVAKTGAACSASSGEDHKEEEAI